MKNESKNSFYIFSILAKPSSFCRHRNLWNLLKESYKSNILVTSVYFTKEIHDYGQNDVFQNFSTLSTHNNLFSTHNEQTLVYCLDFFLCIQ